MKLEKMLSVHLHSPYTVHLDCYGCVAANLCDFEALTMSSEHSLLLVHCTPDSMSVTHVLAM